MKRWLYNVLVAFDMFGNAVFGGLPDETISAHAGRLRLRGTWWAVALSWILDKIQPRHVEGAIEGDLHRAETVVSIEKKWERTKWQKPQK